MMKCSDCKICFEEDETDHTCPDCGQTSLCDDCGTGHITDGCGEVMEDPPIRASDVLSPSEMSGMKSIWK